MLEYVKEFLKMNDVEYRENVRLSAISPIRIGGDATVVVYPNSALKYVEVLRFLGRTKCKFKVVGRMSNILPSDNGYYGIIIRTDRIRGLFLDSNIAKVYSGITNAVLASELCRKGLSGFEELSGIPGSIGGAICGNAGAFGREMSDLVLDMTFYHPIDDAVYTATPDEVSFAYRHSAFKKNLGYILFAKLTLTNSDSDSVSARMENFRTIRYRTQPIGKLSLGSTFKRPNGNIPAARMIDECGLKGYSIGGAQISSKHAGFIINNGDATAEDYLSVAEHASDMVYQKFGVRLEREIELL